MAESACCCASEERHSPSTECRCASKDPQLQTSLMLIVPVKTEIRQGCWVLQRSRLLAILPVAEEYSALRFPSREPPPRMLCHLRLAQLQRLLI